MKHVEQIKKLLRLARDKAASPAEAANALNRAMDLIAKHDVDVATLDLDEETDNLVRENIPCGARISTIKFLIAGLLENYFKVRICLSKRRDFDPRRWRMTSESTIAIVGAESDVQIAIYVFEFLCGAATRAQSAWASEEKKARRKVTGNKKDSFQRGWIYGVSTQLRKPEAAVRDSRAAIVLSNRQRALDAFFEEQFPGTETIRRAKKRVVRSAIEQGFAAGRKTQINAPLNAGKSGQLCLE